MIGFRRYALTYRCSASVTEAHLVSNEQVDELVMVQVKQIQEMGAYVKLVSYPPIIRVIVY